MGEATRYAEERWGSKSRAARLTKAGVQGLATTAGAGDQMSDLAQARTEFFDTVRAASILGKLPVRRIGFRTRHFLRMKAPWSRGARELPRSSAASRRTGASSATTPCCCSTCKATA